MYPQCQSTHLRKSTLFKSHQKIFELEVHHPKLVLPYYAHVMNPSLPSQENPYEGDSDLSLAKSMTA